MDNPVTPVGDPAEDVRVDVGDMPVDQLLRLTGPALTASIQRVLRDIDGEAQGYAAFGNVP